MLCLFFVFGFFCCERLFFLEHQPNLCSQVTKMAHVTSLHVDGAPNFDRSVGNTNSWWCMMVPKSRKFRIRHEMKKEEK